MSVAFNANENANFIKRSVFVDDFRLVHPSLWLIFTHEEIIDFRNKNYIKYGNTEWLPASYRRVQDSSTSYLYSCMCYPKEMFTIINSGSSPSKLASAVKYTWQSTDGNTDILFSPQITGLTLGATLYKHRQNITERAASLKEGVFLYATNDSIICKKYANIYNAAAKDFRETVSGSLEMSYIDSTNRFLYNKAPAPAKRSYKNLFNEMFGAELQIESVSNIAAIGQKYKFRTAEKDIKNTSWLCVKVKEDSQHEPRRFTSIFTEFKV